MAILPTAHVPVAAAQPAQQPTATKAVAGNVDLQRSRVYVRVGKVGLGHEHGVEGSLKSGDLKLGAADNAGTLVFDLLNFKADLPEARTYVGLEGEIAASDRRQINQTLRSRDILYVARYPTATFTVRSSKPVTPPAGEQVSRYELDGEFDLHGVRRPLKVLTTIEHAENALHVRGKFTIKQSDYGIKPYTKFLGTVRVADELTIWGDLWILDQSK
jgi:polyisoprenoid-binding protein YceI